MDEQRKYLYGAAVQGIQSFIFQTNELKDIVGASELVEQICTKAFDEFAINGDYILKAAGNIKFVFKNEKDCRNAVLEFPRKVMTMAPGITISQAVVPYPKDGDEVAFRKAVDALEDKLKAQRNKPMNSITIGLIGVKRAPKTGMPGVQYFDKTLIDEATIAKRNLTKDAKGNNVRKLCNKSFGIEVENLHDKNIAYNIEDITDKNDWIAIIHADGNGLGQVVQKVGNNKEKFREFSKGLDLSTKNAAHAAFEEVKSAFKDKEIIPIRPVVLGGDDMTVICRADFAIKYAKKFIEVFEEETNKNIGPIIKENNVFKDKDKLTCCAGIAFIKSSYPFYYGYNLAESLCDRAKKDAKDAKRLENNGGLAPSCLMFHKVQDSFIESFDEIAKRELTPQPDYSFEYGPYYIHEEQGRWTVDNLFDSIALFDSEKDKGNAAKTNLRQWMTVMYDDVSAAKQRAKRVLSLMDKKKNEKLYNMFDKVTNANNNDEKKFPVYDMLSLYTVIHQVTK
jgi:hypothetical protein